MGTMIRRASGATCVRRLGLLFLLACALVFSMAGPRKSYSQGTYCNPFDDFCYCVKSAEMQKYSWDQSCLAQGPNPNCSLTAGADYNRCMTACGYLAGEGLNLGPDFLQPCFDQCTRTFNAATSGCTNNVETCLQRGEVNYSNDLEYCDERWGGGDWEFWYRDL